MAVQLTTERIFRVSTDSENKEYSGNFECTLGNRQISGYIVEMSIIQGHSSGSCLVLFSIQHISSVYKSMDQKEFITWFHTTRNIEILMFHVQFFILLDEYVFF